MRLINLTITLLGFLVLGVTSVSAQPESGVSFEQLRTDYLYQIERYRTAYQEFQTDKAEFDKLQTLASREKAVTSMKPVLETRAEVAYTYIVALEFLMYQQQGIDIADKNETGNQINEYKDYLRDYIERVPNVFTRDEVNQLSAEFEQQVTVKGFELQNRVLTLLATGRVQNAYDQLKLLSDEFEADYIPNIPDEQLQARIERGFQDVSYQNQVAEQNLVAVVNYYPEFYTQEEYEADRQLKRPDFRQVYNRSVETLQDAYAALKLSARYLSELASQI